MKTILPVILIVTGYGKVFAQSGNELIALYIINLEKPASVEWPNSTSSFTIGIYGIDETSNNRVAKILSQKVQELNQSGKKWRFEYYHDIQEINNCHILFFPNEIPTSQTIHVINKIKGKPILTVANNISGFCEAGGIINFTLDSAKQFQINKNEALKANIKITPGLLMLSEIINTK